MSDCSVVRCSRPARRFSFGLLDGLSGHLCRPRFREAPAGFGLERLATTFVNKAGSCPIASLDACFAVS